MDFIPLLIVLIIGIAAGLVIAAHNYEPTMKELEDKLADAHRQIRKLENQISH